MKFLIDTNVLSAARLGRAHDPRVAIWLQRQERADLATSVIVIGELMRGAHLVARTDAAQAGHLMSWIARIEERFGDSILPIDRDTMRIWAHLSVPDPLPRLDGLIAATALRHGLTVVTRNIKDFAIPGLAILNPFAEA